MAGTREVALGFASVLRMPLGPNPLPRQLWGQGLSDAAEILLAVIDECRDAGIPLMKVELDPELHRYLRALTATDVPLIPDAALQCEVRFYKPDHSPDREAS